MAKKTVIEALKKSPMFQLSLSSKELFHSNFLYWIWNISPALFKDIINELLGHNSSKTWPDKYSVKENIIIMIFALLTPSIQLNW